jgi:hypothetical protein
LGQETDLALKEKTPHKRKQKVFKRWLKRAPRLFFLIYIALEYEKAFNVQRYEIGETWFFVLFFLIFLEAAFIFFGPCWLYNKRKGKRF